jgi:hypothetical protein
VLDKENTKCNFSARHNNTVWNANQQLWVADSRPKETITKCRQQLVIQEMASCTVLFYLEGAVWDDVF